jgi:hypothetical protein
MFPAWLTRSVGCKDQRSRTGRSPRRLGRLPPRLALEHLEGRDLPSFIAPALYDTGRGPYGLAVGDLRGNGLFDVVTANATGASVSLLLGNADGTFQAPRSIPAGGVTGSIAAGHFHDPNILDLVTLDYQRNRVNVLLGNGDATFQPPVSYPVGRDPVSVAVGDFRGDGITDLVVANGNDDTVSVLLGNGDGTFQPAVNYRISDDSQVAHFPRFVTVGDLRGTGQLDIVTMNLGSFSATVLPGNGDGTFGAPIHIDAGPGATAAAIADFDSDGTADLLVANSTTGTVSLLLGNGDDTFQPRVRFAAGTSARAVSVGDFNGDNLPDVAVLNATTISVLLNDGQWPHHAIPGHGPSRGHRSAGTADKAVVSPAPGWDQVTVSSATPDSPGPLGLPLPATAGVVSPPRTDQPVTEPVDRLFAAGTEEGQRLVWAHARLRAIRLVDDGDDPLAATALWLA